MGINANETDAERQSPPADEPIDRVGEASRELAGHGIGSTLVRAGIEFAREQGLTVVPLCPFATDYIRRHQEYLDLVHPDSRARVIAGT